jgi:hypothetical protein
MELRTLLTRHKFSTFVVLILICFFCRICFNAVHWHNHVKDYTVKCTEKGGITHVPQGVKGWPIPECRNPDSIININ